MDITRETIQLTAKDGECPAPREFGRTAHRRPKERKTTVTMTADSRLFAACIVAVLFVAASAMAADWYVDNVNGSDTEGDGSTAKPFQSIARALKDIGTSDTLCLTPNDKPYNERIGDNLQVGGTPDNPLVIDGRGSVIDRLTHYEEDAWTETGDGIWCMPLPNNAWVMDGCWQGNFDLVFFDGQPGKNVTGRDDLTPFSYFLYKNQKNRKEDKLHNTLFIRLPEGKTPASVKVETLGIGTTVSIGRPYVTVRNLAVIRCTQDGFASHGRGRQGIVFENVSSSYNMDQGISHHGSHVVVRNSHFHHNTGGGIVDVYNNANTRYVNCLIEDDLFRGGVEFHNAGDYVLENCIVRENTSTPYFNRSQVWVGNGAKVTLRNCVFIGKENGENSGVSVGDANVTIDNCTFYRFPLAIHVWRQNKLTIRNCAFIATDRSYSWREGPPPLNISSDFNFHESPRVTAAGQPYDAHEWQKFVDETGLEKHSIVAPYSGTDIPYSLPSLKGKGLNGTNIGANLDPAMAVGPETDR